MNVEETKKAIEVMQAFVDGKTVHANRRKTSFWYNSTTPVWNWDTYEYRIKSEPREFSLLIDSHNNVIAGSATQDDFIVVPNGVDIRLTRAIRVREILE